MLKLLVSYGDNSSEEIYDIRKLTLRKSTDTPAHSLEAELPVIFEKEMCKVRLADGDEVVFEGIVDEQILRYGEGGATTIVARSGEALLLDNEACPEIFVNPSKDLVFSRYGRVCSLKNFDADNLSLKGTLRVYKGSSCYQVLKEFCEKVYGKIPFVSGDSLCIDSRDEKDEIRFCDEGEGIECRLIEKNYKRYNLVSRVLAKTTSQGGYDTQITDEESILTGVCRQRFTDMSESDAVSLQKAYGILKEGRRKSLSFELTVSKRLLGITGRAAVVFAGGREYKGFVCKELRYTLKNNEEQTKITLLPKEE